MRLSEIQNKDVINLNTGMKIGNIIDVKIDEKGNLLSLIVEQQKTLFRFSSKDIETEITWDKIETIGVDVILVKM